jgi:hypothetical protein
MYKYNIKPEILSTIVDEPVNVEQYTYYPTWFNTVQEKKLVEEEKLVQHEKKFLRPTVEDIVISGVSGRFPLGENVEELSETLLKGEMIKEKKYVE